MLFRICVACDHTNPPESRFCGKCGAPLQVRFCRLCRSPNDAVSRYCQSCGTELPELTSAEESTPPTAPRPATIPPLVIATPGRPIANPAAVSLESTTSSAAFSAGEADAPDADWVGTRRAEGDARPAIEVLPPQPARAAAVAVDSAVTTNLPAVTDDTSPPARSWREPRVAAVLAIAAIVAAFGVFAFNAWRTGGANQRSDRAEVPAAPQPAATVAPAPTGGTDRTNAAPPALAPEAAVEPAPLPRAASSAKSAPRERREVAPPGAGRTAIAPAPAVPPALRECTPPVAALGLCTPEPKPEGN